MKRRNKHQRKWNENITKTKVTTWEKKTPKWCYTQRNILKIVLNQTETRLYIPFSDWFITTSLSSFKIFLETRNNSTTLPTIHQRNFFGILLIQTEIRLYLPFSEWFNNQSVHGKHNLISIWFNKTWKRFDCVYTDREGKPRRW